MRGYTEGVNWQASFIKLCRNKIAGSATNSIDTAILCLFENL